MMTEKSRWGRAILTTEEDDLIEEVESAFWGAYGAAPNGEGVMGAAEFGCIAAVLAAVRRIKAPDAVALAIGEVGHYGVPRKYKLVTREPGDE